jgi:hypothetical protein
MSDQHFLTTFDSPRCDRCQARMMLERVSPGPIGFEHRLFECPKCDHVVNVIVASDPFEPEAAGWRPSESGPNPITHSIQDGKLIPRPAS